MKVAFSNGLGSAMRDPAAPSMNRKLQVGSLGTSRFQVRGEAIRGDHIVAHSRKQHDTGTLGFVVHRPKTFIDLGLSSDVGVVRARIQAGLSHVLIRVRKRARAVDHDVHVAKGVSNRL
jgi:hypothetical protein